MNIREEEIPAFGLWAKERRRRLDLSREQLAECVVCSPSTVEKVETGERRPSRQIAELLARCLDVPPRDVPALVSFARGENLAIPPSLRALARPNSIPPLFSLPTPPTDFIGREREVRRVRALLRRENTRLVTLTGPPGIGKTRLALQVASGLAPDFRHGIVFIPLSAISDPTLVSPAIARALGVRERGGPPLLEVLKRKLRDKRLLLILDNFEQVATAGKVVAELLSNAPYLRALVTSRAALRVYGEQLFPVAPLTLPDLATLPPSEQLDKYEAIRLFTQRAGAVAPDFRLLEENARAVAEICHRLEGLPLAIELAANRLRTLSPQQILGRLGSRLDLLAEGASDLSARQRSLRNALDWSYDLLNIEEQAAFRKLSVFSGGCSLEAAEAGGFGLSEDNPKFKIQYPTLLGSLVDKSLLRREDGGGEVRFSMLETVREHAWELLERNKDEWEEAVRAHADYYLQLAETSENWLAGVEQGIWLDRLEIEHDNFRVAMGRALERGDVEMAARIGAALRRFWYLRGHMVEGRAWIKKALARSEGLPPLLLTRLVHGLGTLAWSQGEHNLARGFFEESLLLYRQLGDRRGVADMLNNLGIIALPQGDYAQARALHAESLALYRELGDGWSIALALANLGLVALNEGRYAEAESLLTESLWLRQALGDQQGIAQSLNNLGTVARCLGKPLEAEILHNKSLETFNELGDRWSVALALANLGFAALVGGDPLKALRRFVAALDEFMELEVKNGAVTCLEGLASATLRLGDARKAATLFGAVERLRGELEIAHLDYQQSIYLEDRAAAQAVLGEARFKEAWRAGQLMTLVEAVACAPGGWVSSE